MEFAVEIFPDVIETIQRWRKCHAEKAMDFKLFVSVDTGATNTRLSIGTASEDVAVTKFQSDSTQTLVKLLGEAEQLLCEAIPDFSTLVTAGCIAAAGRILQGGQKTEITNYREGAQHQNLHVSELPRTLFPSEKSKIINDLESCCYGISSLNQHGVLQDYFKNLIPVNSSSPVAMSQLPCISFVHLLAFLSLISLQQIVCIAFTSVTYPYSPAKTSSSLWELGWELAFCYL